MTTIETKHEHRICDDRAEGIYTNDAPAVCCVCSGHSCPKNDCDCGEHELGEATLDNLNCGFRPCTGCGKKWYFCAFCGVDDLGSEEELSDHLEEDHPQEVCEHPMYSRSGRHFHICDECGYEFPPPEHDE